MTPEAAAAAIADVKDARQGLTARAAGIVWMVWGTALAGVAMLDIMIAPSIDRIDGGAPAQGWTNTAGAWSLIFVPLAFLAVGVIATNAVWKAHAIERDREHRAWIVWAAVGGLAMAFLGVGIALIYMVAEIWDPATENTPAFEHTYLFITPLLTAAAAVAIAWLQRRRVRMLPGFLVAAALVLVMLFVPLLATGSLGDRIAMGGTVHTFTVLAGFTGVGLWHFHRG